MLACPSMCWAAPAIGADEPAGEASAAGCAHCRFARPAGEPSHQGESSDKRPVPFQPPEDCCNFGNCLCSGALVDTAGIELQLAQVNVWFVPVLSERDASAMPSISACHSQPVIDDSGLLSGWRLRLRIGSLLI
jgi:hypothetical protein